MNTKWINNKSVWISAYLYYGGDTDKFLRKCVSSFVKTMRLQHILHRYFFIRYYESGYHIRLRLLVPDNEERIWKDELEHHFTRFADEQDANHQESSHYNLIRYDPYVQELERYGGNSVITIAEQQFEASSEFLIESQPSLSVAIKMNMALMMGMKYTLHQMIQICKDFVDEWLPVLYDPTKDQTGQKEFFLSQFDKKFQEYADDLVPAVDSLSNELTTARSDDERLASYFTLCQDTREQYQVFGVDLLSRPDIVRSFMHMNHNRLGIRNLDEAYIIHLLYRTLEILRANG